MSCFGSCPCVHQRCCFSSTASQRKNFLRRILKMTQGMTTTNRNAEQGLTFKWFSLFRRNLRPLQVYAFPPESTWASEPGRRCAPLGQRRHKETGREGMRFLATQSPFSPGRASLPWSIPPSCLVIISFYSFLKQSPVLSHFSFHNPVRVCSPSSEQVRHLPSFSPRREALLDPGWSFSFEMLFSSNTCLLSTLF